MVWEWYIFLWPTKKHTQTSHAIITRTHGWDCTSHFIELNLTYHTGAVHCINHVERRHGVALYQKQVSSSGPSNCIPHLLLDVNNVLVPSLDTCVWHTSPHMSWWAVVCSRVRTLYHVMTWFSAHPRQQISWDQHGAHLGPVGPRWTPCWPHELCYQGHRGNWQSST